MEIVLLVLALGGLAIGILILISLDQVHMKISELAGVLETVNTQLDKVRAEVKALKDSLFDVDLPPEAQAALDKLVASVQAIDEINPDAP